MIKMLSWCYYALLTLVIFRLFWLIVFRIFGVYLGSVSVGNGFLLNDVHINTRKAVISASKVHFKLWGNSTKLVITNLNVELSSTSNRTTKTTAAFSSGEPLSIYPKTGCTKHLIKAALWLLPSTKIDIKRAFFTANKSTISVSLARFSFNKHMSVHEPGVYRFNMKNSMHGISGNFSGENSDLPFRVGLCIATASCSTDTSTGAISKLAMRINLDGTELELLSTLNKIMRRTNFMNATEANRSAKINHSDEEHGSRSEMRDQPSLKQKLDNFSSLHKTFFAPFQELSINIGNSRVLGIPLLPSRDIQNFAEFVRNQESNISVSASVSSISFTVTRMTNESAGFDGLFNNEVDHPVEINASILILTAHFVAKKYDEKTQKFYFKRDEFFHLPNFSLASKTNMNDCFASGRGYKDAVFEIFCSGSSPVFDVTTENCALLIYNYVVFKKMMTLNFLKKSNSLYFLALQSNLVLSSDSEDDTRLPSEPSTPEHVTSQFNSESSQTSKNENVLRFENQNESKLDKIVAIIHDHNPRIDIKFTVEQPRTMIRAFDTVAKSTRILENSCSMLILRVANALNKRYSATFDFLHPRISYSERFNDIQHVEEFCGLSDFTISCDVLKAFRVRTAVKIHGAYVNLTKPDVLNGISSILQETTRVANSNLKYGLINNYFSGELARELEINPVHLKSFQKLKNGLPADRMFSNLPSWLLTVSVKVSDIDIQLGSTSPLLPPELISKLSERSERNSENFTHTRSILTLTISEFKCLLLNSSELKNFTSSGCSSSLETLAQDFENRKFWQLKVGFTSSKFFLLDRQKRLAPVIYLPDISLTVLSSVAKLENDLNISSEIGPLLGHLDQHSVFVIIGLAYLVKETILDPFKALLDELGKNMSTLQSRERTTANSKILDYISYTIAFPKITYSFSLSDDFILNLQIYESKIEGHGNSFTISTDFLRLLVNSSNVKGYFNRIACLDSLKFSVNDTAYIQNYVLDATAIRIIQPHQFVTYKLFDSIAVFVKIIKHLVLSVKSTEKSMNVLPTESAPLNIPAIKVKAEKISFDIEDDPFESELGMIYQLGIQEQKKRLEMMDLFSEKLKLLQISDDLRTKKLEELQRSMEFLWIRKIKSYKRQISEEINLNKNYLFGKEIEIDQQENQRLSLYLKFAPLCHFILTGVNLDLSSTRFLFKDLPQFIHDLGQGVPKDTRYNTMIPSYVDIGVKELRIHARDYPLPLLYLPEATDSRGMGNALIMKGHFIICEALTLAKEHLRKLEVQLMKNVTKSQQSSFDKLIIHKSMASTKLYTDLDIQFGSKAPSRFVWGQSYQFAMQQIMANLDQFSKPPVDPSPKLGFWDKIRYIFHGRCVVKATEEANIEFAFKGGRNPYDLFENSSGFVLSFEDHVRWDINSSDNSLEFGKVKSKRVLWYIPNYLSAPLVCWCRESWKSTNFTEMNDLVATCFGYYLNSQVTEKKKNYLPKVFTICEKKVVELTGGVDFTVGFLLERRSLQDKAMSTDGKLHWEIDLYNPIYTKKKHDSYSGFRSDRVHMAITLIAHTEASYNTIHLTPGVFKQFFEWWSLFQGNMMLQVRRGKLFGDAEKSSAKFSEHLFTNKFKFHIKDLFLGHTYQDEQDNDYNKLQFLGMRAKVSEFLVDLHQRKEERVDIHEDLARHKKVMRMNFNKAEVLLAHIDLRMMYAEFYKDVYEQVNTIENTRKRSGQKCKYKVFDGDLQWFDDQDYMEAFAPSTGGSRTKMESLPFMYSEKFSFIRQTKNPDNIDWGEENIHDCMLGYTDVNTTGIEMCKKRLRQLDELSRNLRLPEGESLQLSRNMDYLQQMKTKFQAKGKAHHSSTINLSGSKTRENFHNKFILISMLLKWNEGVRNLFLKYIHFVQLRANTRKYLSYEFVTMLESIIERSRGDTLSLMTSASGGSMSEVDKLKSFLNGFLNSRDRMENFDKIIRSVNEDESFEESFKVQVIKPQIQLHSETVDNSVAIITAPVLESKVITVNAKKEGQSMGASTKLITRYGILLHDASIIVVDKDLAQNQKSPWDTESYGSKNAWPPFLGIEICENHSLTHKGIVLAENMSMMLTYDQVKATNSSIDQSEESHDTKGEITVAEGFNRLRVDVPELTINCTSLQYFSLYVTILSLLLYTEPTRAHLAEKLLKLKFSIDFQDFEALYNRLISLRSYLGAVEMLYNNYSFRHANKMDNEKLNEYILLKDERERLASEICLILQTLFSGDAITTVSTSAKTCEDWRIAADKINLNILTDNREPILNLSIDHGRCKRLINDDGSNHNRIEIKRIEGRSLVKGSYYDKFLEPSYPPDDDDLITVDWSMMRPVGGIKIIENFDINSQPLNVKLDEKTGMELMNFIFHLEKTQSVKESPVLKAATQMGPKTSEDEESNSYDSGIEENNKSVQFKGDFLLAHRVKKKKSLSLFSGSEGPTEYSEDINEMLWRSKHNLSIICMIFHSFELTISLKMKVGLKRWLNMDLFTLKLPEWHVNKEVTSFLGVADTFKSMVIKTILRHSGLLLVNKMRTKSANYRHASLPKEREGEVK